MGFGKAEFENGSEYGVLLGENEYAALGGRSNGFGVGDG